MKQTDGNLQTGKDVLAEANRGREKELTVTAIVLGVLLAIVFGAANAYLGLRVGLTVSASVPAAVISMGVLRFVLRRDSILENNMVQTIGSAGESLAAGAIFTLPALYLWAQERPTEFLTPGLLPVTLIALAGGTLGVLLMIPLRRPLIVEEEKTLIYPEGRACADVLRAGEAGGKHAKTVFIGLGAAALVKFITGWLKWIPESFLWPVHGRWVRGAMGLDISPALIGVGYVVGPKVSSFLFAGGFLGWMVLMPIIIARIPEAAAMWDAGNVKGVWMNYVRYVGAGAIAMGGFLSLVRSMPLFARTFKASMRKGGEADEKDADAGRDLPMRLVLGGLACVIVFIWAVPAVPVSFVGALLIALFGFFFAAVSARMVGLVGSSNNPISGMTIATLVVAALVLKTCGTVGAAGMVASIAIGSVVCIVAGIAGDTAQDLKTGRLLGATPWKQQVGEFIGVIASAAVIGGVLVLLHKAWGFGSDAISAPQATLMKVIVEGIMGGSLPWNLLAIGAGLAIVLALCRIPVMPVAIGIYLPIKLSVTIFLGGLLKGIVDYRRGTQETSEDFGTLFSAGMIAGEGLCGILLAILAAFL
ncbi:MAG: oligopeptide transporter, OPT family [Kiritimatiellae bacterium]|nr:oligopeptide transporter, OPT family [Kiritimatiellia bacterium]